MATTAKEATYTLGAPLICTYLSEGREIADCVLSKGTTVTNVTKLDDRYTFQVCDLSWRYNYRSTTRPAVPADAIEVLTY